MSPVCCCWMNRAPGWIRRHEATCGVICASVRAEQGVTIVLTTHLLEEADKADRIAILHEGRLGGARYAPTPCGQRSAATPSRFKRPIPRRSARRSRARFGCPVRVVDDNVRLEQPEGHQWIARLVEAFPGQIQSITLGKPTLGRCVHRPHGTSLHAGGRLVGTVFISHFLDYVRFSDSVRHCEQHGNQP